MEGTNDNKTLSKWLKLKWFKNWHTFGKLHFEMGHIKISEKMQVRIAFNNRGTLIKDSSSIINLLNTPDKVVWIDPQYTCEYSKPWVPK